MAGESQNQIWPLPNFYFSVEIDDMDTVSFAEVLGLEAESRVIEYRHGNSPIFYPIKMPGLGRVGNVTLRKGIFVNDNRFWDWYNQIRLNTVPRRNVRISLLDEEGSPKMTWDLENAWPTKITGAALRSLANEVAVESLVLAYERLNVTAS